LLKSLLRRRQKSARPLQNRNAVEAKDVASFIKSYTPSFADLARRPPFTEASLRQLLASNDRRVGPTRRCRIRE
jgi:hypothetical protein